MANTFEEPRTKNRKSRTRFLHSSVRLCGLCGEKEKILFNQFYKVLLDNGFTRFVQSGAASENHRA